MTRFRRPLRSRSAYWSVIATVVALSVSGCSGVPALLGIHEAPAISTTTAPLSTDHARRILTRVFTAAYQGEAGNDAAALAARRTAYTGEGLRAVQARVKLASLQPKTEDSPFLAPEQPRLLAVSRGLGFPRFIVAQTVASKGGVPIVHLLISPDAATPYRISVSAEMAPLAKVRPFHPLNHGSPLVTDDKAMTVAPAALLKSYAAWMGYPAKAMSKRPFADDAFSGELRAQAAGVAKAVATQASLSQVHKVVPGSTYTVRQATGDAMVFGVIERKDSFAVKPTQAVNTSANKAFVKLTGKKRVTKSATLTTLEFVVFAVPATTGQATLVAVREQVVAGAGS